MQFGLKNRYFLYTYFRWLNQCLHTNSEFRLQSRREKITLDKQYAVLQYDEEHGKLSLKNFFFTVTHWMHIHIRAYLCRRIFSFLTLSHISAEIVWAVIAAKLLSIVKHRPESILTDYSAQYMLDFEHIKQFY